MKSYYENIVMNDNKFRIKSFLRHTFDDVLEAHPHWHPEIELLYFASGQAKQQINETFFTVGPGDVVVIGKDQLHSTYSYKGCESEILVVQFDAENVLESIDSSCRNEPYVFGEHVIYPNPLSKDLADKYGISELLKAIHRELTDTSEAFEFFIRSALYQLTGILAREGLYRIEYVDRENMELARKVLDRTFLLIDQCYCQEIALLDAANASNLSKTHFCRLFKKSTGMTFMDYLTFYRINRAERMLRTSDSITEVAHECGFGSLSSFIRNFKRFKKCTPSTYKALLNKRT